jgi:putative ATPase
MIYAGEEPRFIFRRMLILACEDVGMADPKALGVVMDAARAFEYVGLPEGRYHLAHACLYLATAPKSNSSMAFFDALKTVSEEAKDDVPNHLRDASRDSEGFGHGEGYLYPHAYRDHWVAQQYLPNDLQGKIFYDPSDQGYEKGIRDRVTRFREAQVEAMIEEEKTDAFELRTLRAKGEATRGSGAWVKRTGSQQGGLLAQIRDELLALADIKHDDLVLDLHARTGLLANEASRITREGGVWALAFDDKEFETLSKGMAGDALRRPQVIKSSFSTFVEDLRQAAGEAVAFNAIIGRNILTQQKQKTALIGRALELLGKSGRIVLAEIVPGQGQRISELVVFPEAESSLGERFKSIENELFGDTSDPMLNWDPQTLAGDIEKSSGVSVKVLSTVAAPKTRVLPENVDFWFRSTSKQERKSLGDRLAAGLSGPEMDALRKRLHEQLDNREIPWKTAIAYIKIARE